jgi:putative toxin-antitoxin system antitoxin component (TIGR02293 family)
MRKPGRASEERETPDIDAIRTLLEKKRGGPHFYVRLLGLQTFDGPRLLEKVDAGFSFKTLLRFQRNIHLSFRELASFVQIKPRTLERRREEGRLNPEESDRLLRASRIFGMALALFEGDADAARSWLSAPTPGLGGHTPLEIARTEVGAREVENLIGRLEHGVFS